MDQDRLWYQFDARADEEIKNSLCDGYFTIAELTVSQYQEAYRLISAEAPPRNGTDRCQEWCVNCMISLETEEIIPSGKSEFVEGLVGLSAKGVAERVGRDGWISAS